MIEELSTKYDDAIMTVIKDIIDLKFEAGNILQGDELEDLLDHYYQALIRGNIELLYRYGELQGYVTWIRLPEIPKSRRFTYLDMDTESNDGSILYIINCCVRDDIKHKILWNLFHRLHIKNPHYEVMCWYDNNGELHKWEHTKHNSNKRITEGLYV